MREIEQYLLRDANTQKIADLEKLNAWLQKYVNELCAVLNDRERDIERLEKELAAHRK